MEKEKSIKQQIVKAAEVIKKKVKKIQNIKRENDKVMESVLKPITDPLNLIALQNNNIDTKLNAEYENRENYNLSREPTTVKKRKLSAGSITSNEQMAKLRKSHSVSDLYDSDRNTNSDNEQSELFFETNSSLSSTPIKKSISSWSLSSEVFEDVPYGARTVNGKLMVGSKPLSVTGDKLSIAGHSYPNTKGLAELLFKKNLDLNVITEEDKKIYKSILLNTNAHRRGYDPAQPINSNRGNKYNSIIKPLSISST